MKFPSKPKRPKVALMRYYEDVIEDVREKHPNDNYKNASYHRSIIKEMYDKLDEKEKRSKYIIPFRNENKLWKKKIEKYEQKYRKKIKKIIGRKPKEPLKPYPHFMKIYFKKLKIENPNFNNSDIFKKLGKLYNSKEKQEELKIIKDKYNKNFLIYKKKNDEYKQKLNNILTSDSEIYTENDNSFKSEDSFSSKSSDQDFHLKKRKKYKSKSKKDSQKAKKNKIFTKNESLKKDKKKSSKLKFKEELKKKRSENKISKKKDKKKMIKNNNSIIEKNDLQNMKEELKNNLESINFNDDEFKMISKIVKNVKKKTSYVNKGKKFLDSNKSLEKKSLEESPENESSQQNSENETSQESSKDENSERKCSKNK